MVDSVSVPYNGTIKLLEKFQDQAGLLNQKQALGAVLFLNQMLISNVRQGLVHTSSDRPDSARLDLAELYEGHIEMARSQHDRDIRMNLRSIDDVALNDITDYMKQHHVGFRKPDYILSKAEIITAAITLATAVHAIFGSGKTGALRIPTIYPERPLVVSASHIFLKPS